MLKKSLLACLAVLVAGALCITGCSNAVPSETQLTQEDSLSSDVEMDAQIEAKTAEDTLEETETAAPESTLPYETFNTSELANLSGTSAYIENNGTCIKLDDNTFMSEIEFNYHEYGNEIVTNSGTPFYEISPAKGDQLITTIDASAKYVPITEMGYLGGISGSLFYSPDTVVDGTQLTGYAAKDSYEDLKEYNELQNEQRKEIQGILKPKNITVKLLYDKQYTDDETYFYQGKEYSLKQNMFYSEEPQSFTCGYYGGTKWIEETVDVDFPVYKAAFGEAKPLPVEKTKNGYFVIDYSSLPAGRYVVWSGNSGSLVSII